MATPVQQEQAASAAVVNVVGFDHLVLRCADVEEALRFYGDTLGLTQERVAAWRAGQVPFPSVRIDATTIIDLLAAARGEGQNVDHFCLVVEPGTDLAALAGSGAVQVVEGPAQRWGAQGMATSLYIRDPDANVVELRAYEA